MIFVLNRVRSTDQGTPGVLVPAGGVGRLYFTLELPWRDNQRRVSCIPAGEYRCAIVQSPKFGRVYGVAGVTGRSHILIHAGNVAGDREKGLRSDVEGCILIGLQRGRLYGQEAVLQSRAALSDFMRELDGRPFTLVIQEPGDDQD